MMIQPTPVRGAPRELRVELRPRQCVDALSTGQRRPYTGAVNAQCWVRPGIPARCRAVDRRR
ncbi:Uncharacterised protein [Mycobacterium tuberculosis]|nr:Uncharacterised protein [Mycobacterium tuberculosis]